MNKRKPLRYDPYNDYYFVLGVLPTATADELQRAYRLRAKQVHPDLNPDRVEWANEQFQRLNAAYDVLGNPSLRIEYDRLRLGRGRRSAPAAGNWWDRPHTPSQPPPPHANASRARSTGTYRPPPGGAARATGAYSRTTGSYQDTADYTQPSRVPPRPSPYRSDLGAVVYGLFTGSNRYIVSAVLALLGSYLLCFGVLSVMRMAPSDIPPVSGQAGGDASNQIVVTIPATDFPPPAVQPRCTDNVHITDLRADQDVFGNFTIMGTATDPDFYSYDVGMDYYGADPASTAVIKHIILSNPAQTPVVDSVLVPVVNFTTYQVGFYTLRLTVTLRGTGQAHFCDVRIYRRQL